MTEDHIRKEKITRLVKHYFSDTEKQTFGEELADAHAARVAAQNDLDTVKKQIGARVTEADGIMAQCVEKIRSGYEMRREPCTVIKDFRECSVKIIRDSTSEVLEDRTMTSEEAQIPLPFEGTPGAVPETQEIQEKEVTEDTTGADDEEEKTEEEVQTEEEKHTTSEPHPAFTCPAFSLTPGQVYNVVVQGPKKKRTRKDFVYIETKTDAESERIAHVFEDPAGRRQIIEHEHVISAESIGSIG